MDYVRIEDALPQMGYTAPQAKRRRCGMCAHGEVTNAGAIRPGYRCNLAARLFEEAGIDNGNGQVNDRLGVCDFFKNWKEAEDEAEAAKMTAADI